MTRNPRHIPARFARHESGSVMVEFAIVVALFFFLFFVLIDFGRMTSSFVFAEKAAQIAVRTAVVREPACAGVPDRHARGTAASAPRFGTSCKAIAGTCAAVATVTCPGTAANATATEIWQRVAPLLPQTATIDNLQFSYAFDPNLGFLGGPYMPVVSVDMNLPDFSFISPLGALATAASGANSTFGQNSIPYPSFSVSLPAEDLALGNAG